MSVRGAKISAAAPGSRVRTSLTQFGRAVTLFLSVVIQGMTAGLIPSHYDKKPFSRLQSVDGRDWTGSGVTDRLDVVALLYCESAASRNRLVQTAANLP